MAKNLNFFSSAHLEKLKTMQGDASFVNLLQGGLINYKDTTLSATALDSANATPITILPAPGAGLANVVVGILTYVDAGATAFELGSGTLGFLYTDGSGASVATAATNAVVESSTDTYYWSVPAAVVPVVNAVIVAKPSADVTAGDGTIYTRVFYLTVRPTDLV